MQRHSLVQFWGFTSCTDIYIYTLIMCVCDVSILMISFYSQREEKQQISNSFSWVSRLRCLGFQLVWVWLTHEDVPMYGSIRGKHRGGGSEWPLNPYMRSSDTLIPLFFCHICSSSFSSLSNHFMQGMQLISPFGGFNQVFLPSTSVNSSRCQQS